MRTLIYVPVFHYVPSGARYDEKIEARDLDEILTKEKPVISEKNSDFERIIYWFKADNFWDIASKELSQFKINRIYQDSYSKRTKKGGVEVLASEGDKDMKLLLDLERKGGNLILSEEGLLLDMYHLENGGIFSKIMYGFLRAVIHLRNPRFFPLYTNRKKNSAKDWRDFYVAHVINSTLKDNETGILFMGRNHNVDEVIKRRYPNIDIMYYNLFFDVLKVKEL